MEIQDIYEIFKSSHPSNPLSCEMCALLAKWMHIGPTSPFPHKEVTTVYAMRCRLTAGCTTSPSSMKRAGAGLLLGRILPTLRGCTLG